MDCILLKAGGGGTGSDELSATAANVLAGATYVGSDTDDEAGTGTMVDKSGSTQSATASLDDTNKRVQLTVPATGKYDTSSKLYVDYSTLASLLGVEAAKMLTTETILGVQGTIGSKAATTYYAITSDQTISAGQYLSGAQTIKKLTQTNLAAANIKTGVTVTVNNGNANVFSVAGTFCSDATLASAANLLSGQIAYGKSGTKYTGNMTNNGAISKSITPSASAQSYTIPAGYHNGSGKVSVPAVSNLTAANIKKGVVVGGVTGTWSGYVAEATDFYLRGNNKGNVVIYDSSYTSFQSGGIYFAGAYCSSSNGYKSHRVYVSNFDLSPYSKLNVELCLTSMASTYAGVRFMLYNSSGNTLLVEKNIVNTSITAGVTGTISVDVSGISQVSARMYMMPGTASSTSIAQNTDSALGGSITGYIYRIWVS